MQEQPNKEENVEKTPKASTSASTLNDSALVATKKNRHHVGSSFQKIKNGLSSASKAMNQTMWKYVLQRIFLIFLTTFIILSLTFILLKMLPTEAPLPQFASAYPFYENQCDLGYYYRNSVNPDVSIYNKDTGETFGYSQYPVLYQYARWLNNVFGWTNGHINWDWGVSSKCLPGWSVIKIIAIQLPVSMKLNFVSLFFSLPLGFIFGIWAALKKDKAADNIISTLVMIFVSIPSFVLISFLLIIFAYRWGVLPSQWPNDAAAAADPAMAIRAYIIPVTALCLGTIAGFTRYMRAELCEVMSSEFLLLARTKGLTKTQTVIRHALRNSMVPIVPMIIGEFVGILGGSMILETIYGINGIGALFIRALNYRDYNVIMVDMAIYTVIGLFSTLLVDLSYGIVDPRIRMGARK
jgi:oligopeptide transport system permease protein